MRLSGAVAAPPPDSYIGASGIYEYAAQPSGFAPTSPTAFYSYPPTAGVITRFQSSSDAVNAGNLGVMGENYTIECLFKSTSVTSYRNLCDMNYNATNVGPRFEQTSDKSACWVWSARGSFTFSPPFALSDGAWYYIAFVMSNGMVSTYLNDVQTASNVPTRCDGFPTTFGSVQIGMGYSADRHFIGEIAMFRIYKTALTAAEVRQNAARAMSRSSATVHTTAPSPEVAPASTAARVPVPAGGVRSIYATDAHGRKTGGFNDDPFAPFLLCCYPGDTFDDVSHLLNPNTTVKTVDTKAGTALITTYSKFYGKCTRTRDVDVPGALRFRTFPTNVFANDFTLEGWHRNGDTAMHGVPLVCSQPFNGTTSQLYVGVQWAANSPSPPTGPGKLWVRRWNGTDTGNDWVFGPGNIPINTFFHFAVTYTASTKTYRGYVNGGLSLTTNWKDTVGGGTALVLGGTFWPTDSPGMDDSDCRGMFQDFRFYTAVKYVANFTVSR